MKPKEKITFADRRFLNKGVHHSLAAVFGKVRVEEDFSNWEPITTEFSMSNCDRTIHLDFDSDSLEAIQNSIYKLEQIEEVARGTKEALIQAIPAFEQWLEEKNRKKSEDSTTSK